MTSTWYSKAGTDAAITAGTAGKQDKGLANFPPGTVVTVRKDPTTGFWPASYATDGSAVYTGGSASAGVRPTSRGDIMVIWKGPDPSPAVVTSGTGGMRDQTGGAIGDERHVTT